MKMNKFFFICNIVKAEKDAATEMGTLNVLSVDKEYLDRRLHNIGISDRAWEKSPAPTFYETVDTGYHYFILIIPATTLVAEKEWEASQSRPLLLLGDTTELWAFLYGWSESHANSPYTHTLKDMWEQRDAASIQNYQTRFEEAYDDKPVYLSRYELLNLCYELVIKDGCSLHEMGGMGTASFKLMDGYDLTSETPPSSFTLASSQFEDTDIEEDIEELYSHHSKDHSMPYLGCLVNFNGYLGMVTEIKPHYDKSDEYTIRLYESGTEVKALQWQFNVIDRV